MAFPFALTVCSCHHYSNSASNSASKLKMHLEMRFRILFTSSTKLTNIPMTDVRIVSNNHK